MYPGNIYHWWTYHHVLNAAIVILLAHLHRVKTRGQVVGTDEGLDSALKPARDLFHQGQSSPNQTISAAGKQCSSILTKLCSSTALDGAEAEREDFLVRALRCAAPSRETERQELYDPQQLQDSIPFPPVDERFMQPFLNTGAQMLASDTAAWKSLAMPTSPKQISGLPDSMTSLSQELLQFLGLDSWPELPLASEPYGQETAPPTENYTFLNSEFDWLV